MNPNSIAWSWKYRLWAVVASSLNPMLCCLGGNDGQVERIWPDVVPFDVKLRPTGLRHLKTTYATVIPLVSDVVCVGSTEAHAGNIYVRGSFYLQDRAAGATYKIQSEPVTVYALFGRRWKIIADEGMTDSSGSVTAAVPASTFSFGSVTPLAVVLKADATVARCSLYRVLAGTQTIVVDLDSVFVDRSAAELANITTTFCPAPVPHSVPTLREWYDRGYFIIYIAPRRDSRFTAATLRVMRAAGLPPGATLLASSPTLPSPTLAQLPPGLSIAQAYVPLPNPSYTPRGASQPQDFSAHDLDLPSYVHPIPTEHATAAELQWADLAASVEHDVDDAYERGPRYVRPRTSWLYIL